MKKRLLAVVMVTIISVAGLAGCGEETSQIGNPWTTCETLEEAVKDSGIDLKAPDTIGGFDTVMYQNMGKEIVEVIYKTSADENASEISIRKGATSEDVGGDYNEYQTVSAENISDVEVTVKENDDKAYAAAFVKDKESYYIYSDKGMSKADLLELATELIEMN